MNMKNDDEMYRSLLSRYEEYQGKKTRRIQMIKRTAPVAACLCFITVLGFTHLERYAKLPKEPDNSIIVEDTTVSKEEPTDNPSASNTSAQTGLNSTIAPSTTTVASSHSNVVSPTEKTDPAAVTTVASDTKTSAENAETTLPEESNVTTPSVSTEAVVVTTSANVPVTTTKSSNMIPFPTIRLYTSLASNDSQYTELKANEIVEIKTNFNPLMSNWSGIGILLEFDSKEYPISLTTNEGHFTAWDKEKGDGIVTNVGKTYDIGNIGYIFWTPDNLGYSEDFESEIIIVGDNKGTSIELGKIIVKKNEKNKLSAVLKEVNTPL